jgi:hypothetical protein
VGYRKDKLDDEIRLVIQAGPVYVPLELNHGWEAITHPELRGVDGILRVVIRKRFTPGEEVLFPDLGCGWKFVCDGHPSSVHYRVARTGTPPDYLWG